MKKELLQQALAALKNSCDFIFKDIAKAHLRDSAIAALESALESAIAQPEQPSALPNPTSPEGVAMIETLLSEYNYPTDTTNAARAGYNAARRLLESVLAQPEQPAVSKAVAYRYKFKGDLQWQYTETLAQATQPCEIQYLYIAQPVQPAPHNLQKRLAELHLYEEIAEHYAKCAVSPEALLIWVAERMNVRPVKKAKP